MARAKPPIDISSPERRPPPVHPRTRLIVRRRTPSVPFSGAKQRQLTFIADRTRLAIRPGLPSIRDVPMTQRAEHAPPAISSDAGLMPSLTGHLTRTKSTTEGPRPLSVVENLVRECRHSRGRECPSRVEHVGGRYSRGLWPRLPGGVCRFRHRRGRDLPAVSSHGQQRRLKNKDNLSCRAYLFVTEQPLQCSFNVNYGWDVFPQYTVCDGVMIRHGPPVTSILSVR